MSSKTDLVPANLPLPVSLSPSGPTESMLVPLVNQFGLMQQQMFDQFQQAIAMMMQMFGTMHRDQMEVIRAELDRLRELTDEVHALKNELAERTRERAEARPGEPELESIRTDRSAAMELNSSVPPSSFEPRRNPLGNGLSEAQSPANQPLKATKGEQQSSREPSISSNQPSLDSPRANLRSQPGMKADSQETGKSGSNPAPESNRDTVLWLHQRIMVLQSERESRWQKILKLMPGMSST